MTTRPGLGEWVRAHFRRHAERGPWAFAWRIGVESTVVSLVAATAMTLAGNATRRGLLDLDPVALFALLVLVAPPLETLLFQAVPIGIVRLFRGSMPVQIVVSTLVFMAVHLPEGLATGIAAGLIGGFYYAFAYALWRERSRWHPLWVTTVCHLIHNLIAFVMIGVFGGLA